MNVQHELKVYVERAVRPVVAVTKTKLKMRTELYAHVQDVFQQELDRQDNEPAALAKTLLRTGEPTALTNEYQESVPRHERIEARASAFIEDRIRRGKGESRLHHAWRVSSLTTLLVAVGIGLTLLPFLSQDILGWNVRGQVMVRFGVGVTLCFGVNMFIFTLLSVFVRDQLDLSVRLSRFAALCLGYYLVTGLCLLATGWVFTFGVSSNPQAATEMLWRWLLLSLAIPPCSAGCFYLELLERRQQQEWTSLEVDS